MFRNLANQIANGGKDADAKKTMSPTLRSDLYDAMDKTKSWLSGGLGGGQAGDGVSYGPILTLIQKHFPNLKLGLELIGHAEHEVSAIVGGVTDMALELSKWEPMAGGMAVRTWADALVEGHKRATAGTRKDIIAKGITRGLNYNTNVALMTPEFTAKIQIISCLKSVSSKLYGAGSDEARQSEAIWSSKFM
ncbi:hypothetical protein CC1G_14102 [Coprinopsis cinerea okayama7|uniref:Uncharacterized protein n=1 Tax=Coprinopsis cinerea (strain Okayama-7 / 130 / ATCC MYA-4618 / FGSC 9003) TaxID=240176 RepID=D6RLI4_COPC7|nr:hypothetical protein CC1G_14102 [Coprinopsis cinerea okayama7\|eukprot:XP_002911570.1 hypothetical protein CC1G_14102 [Coprinopsis cinerea okayama7\